MKRILVTGAGGAPCLNFTRSLRLAPESFYLIGADSDNYRLSRAETDESYLVPKAKETDYIPFLRSLIAETGAELIFSQPDPEIAILSEHRDELGLRTFWPDAETVRICQDKWETYRLWRDAGLSVPETRPVESVDDLEKAFAEYGDVWIRKTSGAAGRGSFHTSSPAQAKAWVDFNGGFEDFTASEYLSPTSVTWQSIWNDGELIVAQGRERISWEFGDRAPSGITGITGSAVTVSDPVVDEISLKAIHAVDPRPHGIFSVDLTYDRRGVPNPTEINIARFFTTHLFFTVAGLNMPYIAVKLAYGEEPPPIATKVNPLPAGLVWVRGMDKEPVLTSLDELKATECQLEKRRQHAGE